MYVNSYTRGHVANFEVMSNKCNTQLVPAEVVQKHGRLYRGIIKEECDLYSQVSASFCGNLMPAYRSTVSSELSVNFYRTTCVTSEETVMFIITASPYAVVFSVHSSGALTSTLHRLL